MAPKKNQPAIRLPNSSARGVNLPRAAANALRTHTQRSKKGPDKAKPAPQRKPQGPNLNWAEPGQNTRGWPSGKDTRTSEQRAADNNRSRTSGTTARGGGQAITLPNSRRAGTNLIKTGADKLRNEIQGPRAPQSRPSAPASAKPPGSTAANAARNAGRAPIGSTARSIGGGAASGMAAGLIYQGLNAALSPLAQRAGNALGKEIRRRLTPQRPGTESGRTGRGGTTANLNPRPVTRRTPAARPAPDRQRPAEAQLEAPRPSGGPPRGGGMGSSSGRGSSTGNRSASGTGSSTTPTSPTSQSPTSQAPASNGNPGRGTSRTNNPLIKNDSWMMDKLRAREQASADAAISAGKASPARYNVQASPAEYNVSEEEGKRRLMINPPKDDKKKKK